MKTKIIDVIWLVCFFAFLFSFIPHYERIIEIVWFVRIGLMVVFFICLYQSIIEDKVSKLKEKHQKELYGLEDYYIFYNRYLKDKVSLYTVEFNLDDDKEGDKPYKWEVYAISDEDAANRIHEQINELFKSRHFARRILKVKKSNQLYCDKHSEPIFHQLK